MKKLLLFASALMLGSVAFAAESSEACGVAYTSGNSTAYFSLETADNGDVWLEIKAGEGETGMMFRNNAPDISGFTVDSEDASIYFDNTKFLNDKKTVVVLPKKIDAQIESGATIEFDGTLEWKSDLNGNAWTFDGNFSFSYGRICCIAGEQLQAEVTEVTVNSASIQITNKCIAESSYEYRLIYKEEKAEKYDTIPGLPEGNIYEITGLYSDAQYEAYAQAAYPSFDDEQSFEESKVVFSTASKGSEACSLPYSSGESNIQINMETVGGNIIITITGDETEENLHFRDEGITKNINLYTVNGEAASDYFADPSLSADLTVVTIKKIADVPEGAEIKFNDGVIAWSSEKNTNAYVTNQSITHTYGTVCCSQTGFRIIRSEGLTPTTAVVEINNSCLEDQDYVYRYSYKQEEAEEYGETQPLESNIINFTDLTAGTSYLIKVEAAYKSFDIPETDKRTVTDSFTTTSMTPAPTPTLPSDSVKSVYSSKYGVASNLNWNYYTFAEETSDLYISSESTLRKCVMKADGEGVGNQENGVLIKLPTNWDLTSKDSVHFDLFITTEDVAKSSYVGFKLRHGDGANTSWYACGTQLQGDAWNSYNIPIQWFVDNEGLQQDQVLSMMIIPTVNNVGSKNEAQFSTESFTIYIDNLYFFTNEQAPIPTDAAEASEDGFIAYIADGIITIAGLESGEAFQVYSLSNLVYAGEADGAEFKLPVSAGVYIVKAGDNVVKLISK